MRILYTVIDGEITGGNIICLKLIEEALSRGYTAIVNSPTEGKFIDILREKGIKIYNIDTRHSFRLDSAIKLARLINKEDIKLLHSHVPLGGIILSRLGGWLAGAPVINHAHLPDTMHKNLFVRQIQFLLNWFTSRLFCTKVIAVCENVKKEIIKQGVSANKITVVYNGVNLDDSSYCDNRIGIRKEFGLKENQRIIGEVARLCKVKGQHILIKAARRVLKEYPDTVFMIVGEDLAERGKYGQGLKVLASELGLNQKVIFTDYRNDVWDILDALDLFVLPSSAEGIPLVILEAMAAKRPVIATSVGGNTEVVIDGETGTLVPADNPDRLSETILYHLKNPEVSKRMGENGYERVRDYFSLSQMLDRVMDIYKEIFKQRQWQL